MGDTGRVSELSGGGAGLGYDIMSVTVRTLPDRDRGEGLSIEVCGREREEERL